MKTLLKIDGRAAIVVPDNVLFEGGAGETVRRKLLHECDVHTLLRMPHRRLLRAGVKCNVLLFDWKSASETPWTEALWIYDLRTNQHFTLKERPLRYEDLEEFVSCYNAENWRKRVGRRRSEAPRNGRCVASSRGNKVCAPESLEPVANLPTSLTACHRNPPYADHWGKDPTLAHDLPKPGRVREE